MSQERDETSRPSEEELPRARPADASHLTGAAFRRRLLGSLAPLPHQGSRIRDAIDVSSGDDTLQAALDLDADGFLEPLWALVEGKGS